MDKQTCSHCKSTGITVPAAMYVKTDGPVCEGAGITVGKVYEVMYAYRPSLLGRADIVGDHGKTCAILTDAARHGEACAFLEPLNGETPGVWTFCDSEGNPVPAPRETFGITLGEIYAARKI